MEGKERHHSKKGEGGRDRETEAISLAPHLGKEDGTGRGHKSTNGINDQSSQIVKVKGVGAGQTKELGGLAPCSCWLAGPEAPGKVKVFQLKKEEERCPLW